MISLYNTFISGNVVWLEPWQAARAMLERSSRNVTVQPSKKSTEGEAMDQEESKEEPEVTIPTPPGVWRLGIEYPLAKSLVMRFATKADRKIKGAERLSQYYRNHGNPNYGGMVGLISSSRKRRFRGKTDPAEQVDSKNPWGSLAKAWGDGDPTEAWEVSDPQVNWGLMPESNVYLDRFLCVSIIVFFFNFRETFRSSRLTYRLSSKTWSSASSSVSFTVT